MEESILMARWRECEARLTQAGAGAWDGCVPGCGEPERVYLLRENSRRDFDDDHDP